LAIDRWKEGVDGRGRLVSQSRRESARADGPRGLACWAGRRERARAGRERGGVRLGRRGVMGRVRMMGEGSGPCCVFCFLFKNVNSK
jgi:hypothetical protein